MKKSIVFTRKSGLASNKLTQAKKTMCIVLQRTLPAAEKFLFSDCMMSVVCMHGGTLFSEILEYFPRNMDVPTVSAYLQQRAKD